MTKATNRSGAGGGINSRQVRSSNGGRKAEPRSQGIRPGAVSQIGSALGNKAMESPRKLNPAVPARTPGYNAPVGANVNAKPNVHPSGGQHSLVQPRNLPAGRPVVLEPGRR